MLHVTIKPTRRGTSALSIAGTNKSVEILIADGGACVTGENYTPAEVCRLVSAAYLLGKAHATFES